MGQQVHQAYDRVRGRQLGSAVFISDLATELQIGVPKLHEWIRSEVIESGHGSLDEVTGRRRCIPKAAGNQFYQESARAKTENGNSFMSSLNGKIVVGLPKTDAIEMIFHFTEYHVTAGGIYRRSKS